MAPECSTTGSNAAARPPVMGSLGLPRATRFETTTNFTGRPLLFIPPRLTAVHQDGSCHHFYEMKPKSGARVGTSFLRRNPAFSVGKESLGVKFTPYELRPQWNCARNNVALRCRCLSPTLYRRGGAQGMRAHLSAHRSDR